MAGEQTYTTTRALKYGGLTVGGTDTTTPAAAGVVIQETIEAGTVNRAFAVTILAAKMLAQAFSATVPMTIKTNNTSAPDETITLVGNQEKIWDGTKDTSGQKLITHDLTVVYVSNAGASPGLFKMVIPYNPN